MAFVTHSRHVRWLELVFVLDLLPLRSRARKLPVNAWLVLLHYDLYYAFQKLAAGSFKALASL